MSWTARSGVNAIDSVPVMFCRFDGTEKLRRTTGRFGSGGR